MLQPKCDNGNVSVTSLHLPEIVISRRGADRIRAGHVWVYRSDVLEARNIAPGALVSVEEVRGSDKNVRATRPVRALGSALYSTASEIAIRMLSRKPVEDLEQLIAERIREAIIYRERFVQNTNAYRVIFSEGDLLPGLIVDRYDDLLIFQALTQAMDSERLRSRYLSELREAFNPSAIVERVDPRVRTLEQLPDKKTGVVFSNAATWAGVATPTPKSVITEFQMNGVRFKFDPFAGQKTGAFLDQRENYAAAAQYAQGEVLDVFCYQGGFALHLAKTCDKVTGVDSSRPALEAAEENAKLNGREIEWIEANGFDLLRDYAEQGKKYDCIVLDPPAFAKSRHDVSTALRGYKELNLRALKMLRPGGLLVTCSCSYHVSAADLLETVFSAAQDSHRIVFLLENRGAAKDHPNQLGIPETAYLKCLIMHVT